MPEIPSPSDQRVAVVTTGGTIASILSDSSREVNPSSKTIGAKIDRLCEKLGAELELVPSMNALSENMEPEDWATIGDSIKKCIDEGYESIVVTHGTDTMVYSATAFENALGEVPAKVIFTGSLYGPDTPDNDVEIALQSSIEASLNAALDNGVYINFRSPDTVEEAHLHRAVDTRPLNMDDLGFRSLFDRIVGQYSPDNGWSWTDNSSPTRNNDFRGVGGIPDKSALSKVFDRVQFVHAVPGQVLPKTTLEEGNPDVMIVSLYHSGTASDSTHSRGLREFIQKNRESTEILLVGMSSDVVPVPYESTKELVAEGARLIQDVQPHVVYTAMYMGLAQGLSIDEIIANTPGFEATFNGEDWSLQ